MKQLLEELFENYYQDIYRYLYSLCGDAELSEDLASEVFLEAVGSIATFRRLADIKTWLFSIARHRWFAYLRKKKQSVKTEEYPFQLLSDDIPLEDRSYRRELSDRIQKILEKEQERTIRVFRMRMDGYSFREISVAVGISENSARVIEFRLKTKIRRILKEEGFE